MKTDGIFTTNKFRIRVDKPNKPIYIAFSGDWHVDSPNHDKIHFHEWLEECKNKQAYLVGIGDYTDLFSSSERRSFKSIELHDSSETTIEDMATKRIKDLSVKIKKYFGNRIIGLAGGNHYYTFSSGIHSDQLLCQYLGCPYLGTNSLFRICFDIGNRGVKLKTRSIDVCVHHGQSGGRTVGASMNKLQTMANSFNADIIVQGHDHNRAVDYINRLELSQHGQLENKKILLGRTGSFLKSYELNKPSYAIDALYPPADLGALMVAITLRREINTINGKKEDNIKVEIKATI